MPGESRSVVVRLSLDTAQAIRSSKEFGTEMDRAMTTAERSSARASQSLDKVGSSARNMAIGTTAVLVASAKAAVDWESQFAGVEKTVDGTREQITGLEDDLREMARTMPATHQEIAATAEAAGQLGVATEDVASFTETMIKLGETTNVTAEGGATSIAQFMNVMQSAAGDVDEIANTIVDLGNKGASTEGQILDMAQRIAGAGSLIGASESDVLALSAAMANLGIESELGGGAVQRVLTNINSEVKSGGPDLAKFAEISGKSAAQFAQDWGTDPIAAFDDFIQGLGRIQDSGGDVVSALSAVGIEGTQNLQVMLRLAGAGDTLTTALDQSGTAWEQNSALIEEYARRAGTTASESQVAWNQIKDAGIEAGESLLPVLSEVASIVGTVASAFGSLPDPVQGAFVQLLAIGALVGGATWFGVRAYQGIASTREAMQGLATDSPRASRAMRGLAIAGAALAGLTVAAAAITAIQDASKEALPGVNDLTLNLLELRSGKTSEIVGEMDSLSESIRRINEKSSGESFGDFMASFSNHGTQLIGLDATAGSLKDATAEIELLDEALAGLVSQGGPEVAAEALASVGEALGLSKGEVEQLVPMLDLYNEALAGSAAAEELRAESAQGTADAMGASAEAAQLETAAQEEAAEALQESRDAAQGTAESFFNLGDSLNDSKTSLGEWIEDMNEQSAALRDFRVNAEEAADRGLRGGLIAALQEAGPEGAMRMRELADATDGEIAKANAAWGRGQREIRKYTDAVGGVPKSASTDLAVNGVPRSLAQIMSVRNYLDLLPNERTIYITTRHRVVGNVADALPDRANTPRRADGGQVFGPGGPRDDLIPARLSNREYVMPVAAVDHYGVGFMEDIRTRRLADGGSADGKKPTKRELVDRAYGQFAVDVDLGVSGVRSELDDLRDALKDAGRTWTDAMREQSTGMIKAARQYDRLNEALDDARQAQASFASDVASSFDGDLFGNGIAGLMTQLEADRNDSRAMQAALAQAQAKGLDVRDDPRTKGVDESALYQEIAASGDLNTAQQLAGMSAAEIRQLEKLYASTGSAQQALGSSSAQNVYGQQIKDLQARADRAEKRFDREMRRFLKDELPYAMGEATYRGAKDGIEGRERSGATRSRMGR